MHNDLKHLNISQMKELMSQYYAGVGIAKLKTQFDFNISSNQLYKFFPPAEFSDYTCEYCDTVMAANRSSKSMQGSVYERDLYCPQCDHKPYVKKCTCENCKEKEILIAQNKIRLIHDVYSKTKESIPFNTLSFRQKVYLGTVCRALLDENLSEIHPVANSPVKIAPTKKMLDILYKDLTHNSALVVSPNSPLEAFSMEEGDEFPYTYYICAVKYVLNLEMPPNKIDLINQILNPDYYSEIYRQDAYDLWLEIAIEECIEYLLFQLEAVGFDGFNPGDKTYLTIKTLLNDFSTSQIYGIIWKSVADASKLYLEKGISRNHAANSVIGACQRLGERAVLNNWQMTRYSRTKQVPQSTLSEFYFNKVVNIGSMGFDIPPTYI